MRSQKYWGTSDATTSIDIEEIGDMKISSRPKLSITRKMGSLVDEEEYPLIQLFRLSSESRDWVEISRWVKYQQDLEPSGVLGKPHVSAILYKHVLQLLQMTSKSCFTIQVIKERGKTLASAITRELGKESWMNNQDLENLEADLDLSFKETKNTAPGRRLSFDVQERSAHQQDAQVVDLRKIPLKLERRSTIQSILIANGNGGQGSRRGSRLSFGQISLSNWQVLPRLGESENYEDRKSIKILVYETRHSEQNRVVIIQIQSNQEENDEKIFQDAELIFLVLSAPGGLKESLKMSKPLGAILSNKVFLQRIRKCPTAKEVHSCIEGYVESLIVFPLTFWNDKTVRDLLPLHILEEEGKQPLEILKNGDCQNEKYLATIGNTKEQRQFNQSFVETSFKRTGKLFGGLMKDVKRRFPFYTKDFGPLNFHTLATIVFLYLTSFAHNVTFGGLLGEKTNGLIGLPETLLSTSISGILFSLTSAQPLAILGVTGPLLLFDELLYNFLESWSLDFLTARAWIGIWIFVLTIITTGFEGASFSKNFTPFSTETFSGLSSLIFVYDSLRNLVKIFRDQKLSCECDPTSQSQLNPNSTVNCAEEAYANVNCHKNAAISMIIMFGTFYIAYELNKLKKAKVLPAKVRNFLADYALPIAIFLMIFVDSSSGEALAPRIKAPHGVILTAPELRGWFVSPFPKNLNKWLPIFTILPATVLFLLIFITAQMGELLMLRIGVIEKGSGLHLNPVLIGVINLFSGIFGFPWLSIATIKSLAHVRAACVYSKDDPPGVAPRVIGVQDNRVSGLAINVLLGLSIFMSPVLKQTPLPVLFGVFLYSGITSITPTRLYQRMLLLITPKEDYPQTEYVRKVPTWKIHVFTLAQISCLALLWIVKSVKEIALCFPLVLLLLIPARKAMTLFFSQEELQALDGTNSNAPLQTPLHENPKMEMETDNNDGKNVP